jgi:hypothetical protein
MANAESTDVRASIRAAARRGVQQAERAILERSPLDAWRNQLQDLLSTTDQAEEWSDEELEAYGYRLSQLLLGFRAAAEVYGSPRSTESPSRFRVDPGLPIGPGGPGHGGGGGGGGSGGGGGGSNPYGPALCTEACTESLQACRDRFCRQDPVACHFICDTAYAACLSACTLRGPRSTTLPGRT